MGLLNKKNIKNIRESNYSSFYNADLKYVGKAVTVVIENGKQSPLINYIVEEFKNNKRTVYNRVIMNNNNVGDIVSYYDDLYVWNGICWNKINNNLNNITVPEHIMNQYSNIKADNCSKF